METILLASTSPRRVEMLGALGIPCELAAPGPERELPRRLKRSQIDEALSAVAFAKGEPAAAAQRSRLVLAADTIVWQAGVVLGKPTSAQDAERMLARLSGREHVVFTAVALFRGTVVHTAVEATRVAFRSLSSEEIRAYVRTGEPLDKAGGYGIQGRGGYLVREIHGRYDNVVGLPMLSVYRLMREFGIDLLQG